MSYGETERAGAECTAAEVERQVQTVAASAQFASAEVLRGLLLFLAKRRVEEPGTPPKEIEIATAVLGRSGEFDSRLDSSVRVLVGRLRSKLAEYYVGAGAEDGVVLEVPKGSYALVARPRAVVEAAPARGRRGPWGWVAAGACLVAGLGLGWFLRGGEGPGLTAEQRRFWAGMLESPRPLVVVVGAPRFATVGADWVVRSPKWMSNWPEVAENTELGRLEELLKAPAKPVHTYVAAGEALAALTLTQELGALRPRMRFRRSSQFQWDEMRSQDVIFLGAPKINPPTKDFPLAGDFECDLGEIRNLRPKAGEAASYGTVRVPKDGAVVEGHALVTRYAKGEMFGEVVLIGSPVSEGTWAAADYVSKPAYLKVVLEKIAKADGRVPERFQMVVRYRMKADVPLEIGYVTHHELGR